MGTGCTFSFNPAELRSGGSYHLAVDSVPNYEFLICRLRQVTAGSSVMLQVFFLKVQLIFIITDCISKLKHDVATTW